MLGDGQKGKQAQKPPVKGGHSMWETLTRAESSRPESRGGMVGRLCGKAGRDQVIETFKPLKHIKELNFILWAMGAIEHYKQGMM